MWPTKSIQNELQHSNRTTIGGDGSDRSGYGDDGICHRLVTSNDPPVICILWGEY